MVNLRIGSISGHLFFPFEKAGGRKIRSCQGLAVYYGCTLGALALKPSGFCNIGVNKANESGPEQLGFDQLPPMFANSLERRRR
jgi:hypothetical protein